MRRCPTCGAELENKALCYRCGTLPELESAITRTHRGINNFIEKKIAAIPRRLQRHHFLWACALVPLFILPPLAALTYAIVAMRRQTVTKDVNYEWIAIIATLNILLSAMILYKLHIIIDEIYGSIPDLIRVLLRRLFPFEINPIQPPAKTTTSV
jgi:uncharacterized membrane protein YvbJ